MSTPHHPYRRFYLFVSTTTRYYCDPLGILRLSTPLSLLVSFQSPPPRTSLAMVKTRSKKTNEPVPVTQASTSRKRQTSNADKVQNKRTKIDDDEESNDDQSKKKKGKGTKKKGKQPRYVISTSLRSIFLIFFFAGKRLHRKLPRMLQLMLQVLLFIYPSKYSRLLTIFF